MALRDKLNNVQDIIALLDSGDEFTDGQLRAVQRILKLPWVPVQGEIRQLLIDKGHIEV